MERLPSALAMTDGQRTPAARAASTTLHPPVFCKWINTDSVSVCEPWKNASTDWWHPFEATNAASSLFETHVSTHSRGAALAACAQRAAQASGRTADCAACSSAPRRHFLNTPSQRALCRLGPWRRKL